MKSFSMRAAWLAAAAAVVVGAAGQARAGNLIGYGTGPDPWGNTVNDAAMNGVFGNGNWNKFNFSTAAGSATLDTALKSGDYKMIFLDGGDGAGDNFKAFVNTYRSDLVSFVSDGGSLILNAATWSSGTLDLGFGVTLHDNIYSVTGTAADPANTLFQDHGFGAPGAAWSGNYFSHDSVTGDTGTTLITGDSGQILLSQKSVGSGFVMFGGITTPNYQNPNPEAFILRENMLYVAANVVPQVTPTPEPSTLVSGGVAGLMGLGLALRRRKTKAIA